MPSKQTDRISNCHPLAGIPWRHAQGKPRGPILFGFTGSSPSKYRGSCIDNLTNGQALSVAMRTHGKNQDFAVDSACKSKARSCEGRKEEPTSFHPGVLGELSGCFLEVSVDFTNRSFNVISRVCIFGFMWRFLWSRRFLILLVPKRLTVTAIVLSKSDHTKRLRIMPRRDVLSCPARSAVRVPPGRCRKIAQGLFIIAPFSRPALWHAR